MDPSTSPASPPEGTTQGFDVEVLARFYRWHAPIYDWTRPFILFGRADAVLGLDVRSGSRVLDIGCGTGSNFPRLAARGAEVVGIECSPAMRRRAEARVRRLGAASRIRLDPRPYGTHAEYRGSADRVLFSYSLTMIPPFPEVLARAQEDLAPGGRIGVVDFLDAAEPVGRRLSESHVALGEERLSALKRLFPAHRVEIRSTLLWRYFLFWGGAGGGPNP